MITSLKCSETTLLEQYALMFLKTFSAVSFLQVPRMFEDNVLKMFRDNIMSLHFYSAFSSTQSQLHIESNLGFNIILKDKSAWDHAAAQ